MRLPSLGRDERGAAMVFGLFFAVFLLGMVWYLVGLADTLDYRQRMQDASDAAAFSAAVVNARGMNLLALINMTMAAILSVLVGLRLAQTLGMVAIGICAALAWITGGASMAPVPLLVNATSRVGQVADKVEKTMPALLTPLHMAGKAVSVVVPVGANLTVIDLVAKHHDVARAGIAIPSRFTLPVEDDDFDVLCEHAGQLAGKVALFPLSPILPDRIESKISGAAAKIAAAGSSWFCGGDGEPPDLNSDEDTQVIEYPIMPLQQRCNLLVEVARKNPESETGQVELERVCKEAAVEYLASLPNRKGQCRRGQPVCPTDCEGSTRMSCPPTYFEDCPAAEAAEYDALAPDVIGGDVVSCGPRRDDGRFDYTQTARLTAYERRLIAARGQCDPTRKENRGKRGYAWLERTLSEVYVWDAKHGWSRDAEQTTYGEQRLVEHDNRDATRPCEGMRDASEYEGKELRVAVCQGDRVCQTPEYLDAYDQHGACLPPKKPARGQPLVYREQLTQVMDMVRCAEEQDLEQVAVERMDVSESLKKNKEKGGKNTSPFRLEKGVWLGGSDFQLRSLVFGTAVPAAGENVIELSSWGQGEEGSEASRAVNQLAQRLGRVGVSQAEYYFDWTGLAEQPSQQLDEHDVTEWLWHMAWRARLRPFRLNHSKADGPRPKDEAGPDAEQLLFMPEKLKQEPTGQELDCGGIEGCEDAQQVIDIFGDGES